MNVQNKLHQALIVMGVQQIFSQLMSQSNSPQSAAKQLEVFKGEAKKRYQQLMLEVHPDRGGDEEKAKELTAAWNEIKGARIVARPPPPPPPQVMIIFQTFGSMYSSTDTSTTYTSGTGSFYGF